jgi:hypothetical protein
MMMTSRILSHIAVLIMKLYLLCSVVFVCVLSFFSPPAASVSHIAAMAMHAFISSQFWCAT